MQYPDYMTAEEIRAFELEMNDRIDSENKAFHDSLERRCDEQYEPEDDYDYDLEAGEDFSDGWDGQPDEAQEWYDFDPDC